MTSSPIVDGDSSLRPSVCTGDASIRRRPRSGLTRAAERVCAHVISLILAQVAAPITILATRRVQRVLLTIVVLNISLGVEKHLFLRQDAADLGSLGGLQISLTNIALTGLYVAWLVRSIVQSGSFAPQRLKLNRVALPAVLFLLFCAVSLVVAGDTTLGVFGFVSVIERFLLFLYIATAITSDEDVLFIFRILLIGLVI